ncbi:diaminopimelate epimerase [Nocardia cyriacigeorgica]|uniref:diaminopimelate epimerase n=1 Tax=Nocardia cyriacigeorgica TaxID=135487 RepID=UPI0018963456|nr:diaminopimelate epimerase [Nocardia cyriacigeorgica]MBF6097057.1 diaminopimelate epimerase [Nocardia cyriacigeorgica]MBF6158532.1 diaminopimelate epimerase [Nocardia cyriacigeorgica]MBF6197780.1 diaminopimelate epimerase [Nocardia cyriacigeorgica]MBF6316641.1 diaminopimelate epimerase [Nocardia cyriacigeorgica]MBF6517773.1 diaminopimelate epimerase [Nocardia cyriacigeorgica]
MEFTKGHGTQNDFVVLPDPQVRLELTVERIAALCDRQRGLGADGVLRVARAGALRAAGVLAELPDGVGDHDWFMDYRNADGSIAEMCGNGVRVFAHYLAASGLETRAEFVVGSRAGARPVTVHAAGPVDGEVTVAMGDVRELGESTATVAGWGYSGIGIDVGNPHLACVDPGLTADALAKLDLTVAPGYDPDLFPQGVNIELVTALDATGAVDMRVYERGVGETRSCGTGTVAAAAAALAAGGFRIAEDTGEVTVRVPGGEVSVALERGRARLRGPSVLVATGRIAGEWWQGR